MIDFNVNFGEMSGYERKLLYEYVLKTEPKTVLEIGAGKGGSTHYILLGFTRKWCFIFM